MRRENFSPLFSLVLGSVMFFSLILLSGIRAISEQTPIISDSQQDNNEEGIITVDEENGNSDDQNELDSKELRAALDDLKDQVSDLKADLKKKQDKQDNTKKFSCKVGGNLIMDALALTQSDASRDLYGQIDNQVQARDARISISGEGYGFLSYGVVFGINKEEVNFKDVTVTAKDMPIFGDLTVGHFKVETNMDYLQRVFDTPSVDFDSNTNTFCAGRKLGVGSTYYTADKQGRLFLGLFTGKGFDTKSASAVSDSAILLNARATAIPIYRRCGDDYLDEVLHIGTSYYWTRLDRDSQQNFRLRPTGWVYSMPYLFGGKVTLEDYSVLETEIAWQKGGFALQCEGFYGSYDGLDNGAGVTGLCRYMLTPGAFHEYDKSGGRFFQVVVPEVLRFVDFENWKYFQGYGAVEAICQWSYTDLDNLSGTDNDLVYGTYNELLAGLNWFWNSQTRWSFNWVHAMPSSTDGTVEKEERESDTFVVQMRIKF